MSKTDIKKQKDFFKSLDKFYTKSKDEIIHWLKTAKEEDNKITGLLNTTKMQIITQSEYGNYNLLLMWFIENNDKFKEHKELFDNIPSTNFIKISSAKIENKMKDLEEVSDSDIEQKLIEWKKNPKLNPFNRKEVKISIHLKSDYSELYSKFINFLVKDFKKEEYGMIDKFEEVRSKLPTDHIYVCENFNYIKKLKDEYVNEECEWINYLNNNKKKIYTNESILNKKGITVYDHLFMHYYFILYKDNIVDEDIIEKYIDNQLFIYSTIKTQIILLDNAKIIETINLSCDEIFKSMLNNDINFKIIEGKPNKKVWTNKIPPLLQLFTEYIDEITYYILPISCLKKVIFDEYFLYGKKISNLTKKDEYRYTEKSIEYHKYRLKTTLNIIFGTLCDNSSINIKLFCNSLWKNVGTALYEKYVWDNKKSDYTYKTGEFYIKGKICEWANEYVYHNKISIEEFKIFLVSSIFDIESMHKESNNITYEPIEDPYNNLPEIPKMPKAVYITQELQKYKMTSHITGKKESKEAELKIFEKKKLEYKKELKNYDKELKEYNDKYLDKKLSPYFSIKLKRAVSLIDNNNSLKLMYSPLKVNAKSLDNFKLKKNKIKRNKENFSDLKLKLALEADKFKSKLLDSNSISAKQRYIGCDINDKDPLTMEEFSNMHFKKIKYLSKIKSKLENGKTITHCYDTIPLYNYILHCKTNNEKPKNVALGNELLTIEQMDEVFKKIKYFTKKPTLEINTDINKKIFLKTLFEVNNSRTIPSYNLIGMINVGSIFFKLSYYYHNYEYYGIVNLFNGALVSRDDILFEDTSDNTVLLIQKGIDNSTLLLNNNYPYWMNDNYNDFNRNIKILLLPPYSYSNQDTMDQLIERTRIFNNRLLRII
tara:strand:- start:2754 stop:5396 length:2643 start_codon:yes stop_codon:yes gene_type:complete